MRKIEVFVDDQGRPQHLAVVEEQNPDIKSEKKYRTLCGQPQGNTKVVETTPEEAHISCDDCEEQLEMWKEVMR